MELAEEKSLISRAKKGELAAFEALVTAYERRVFALALRSAGNAHDAQDISQEVFLRVYRSLPGFRGESGFATWVYRITMNQCVDFARKGAGAPQTAPLETDEGERPMPDPDRSHQPEAAAENQALREELAAALALLSSEHRTVLLLRDESGLSYAEISRALSLEEGTVKSRLARARRALRDILVERGNISLPAASKQTEGRASP